ncbi:hypothetical protein BDB01DRAFT_808345 [Pilobolus umbonatus]|nr:hypothetical protein BDB01DRAFT_808345 [Pilobolus umbonatus]
MLSLRHDIMDEFIICNDYGEDRFSDYESEIITEEICALNEIDCQGINWSFKRMTRQEYREIRNKDYENYFSCQHDSNTIKQSVKTVDTTEDYYSFKSAKLNEKCSIGHFQLRNLLNCTNKNNYYYVNENIVTHWSPQGQKSQPVMDLTPANQTNNIPVHITSLTSKYNILFAGGFQGECVWKVLDDHSIPLRYNQMMYQENIGITNYTEIIENKHGLKQCIVSNNDSCTRYINLETTQIENTLSLAFPINCSSMSPNKNILCLVGDSTETHLVDAYNGQAITIINEHHDYSFSCCWSPDGNTFVTGNQDKTSRVYDIRNTSQSLCVLGTHIGAVRSLHFSNDGRYLAAAEPLDYVHIYETNYYDSCQVIDMFGDIAGVCFTPDDSGLLIANADARLGGLFEFQRVDDMIDFYYI